MAFKLNKVDPGKLTGRTREQSDYQKALLEADKELDKVKEEAIFVDAPDADKVSTFANAFRTSLKGLDGKGKVLDLGIAVRTNEAGVKGIAIGRPSLNKDYTKKKSRA